MQLAQRLPLNCIKAPMVAQDKQAAIVELVEILHINQLLLDYDCALKAVLDREAVRSTGIGQGFAIPHGKCDAVDDIRMAMGVLPQPIDFQSIDKRPVQIMVLLISPLDATGPHIQALARVSRLMTDKSFHEQAPLAGDPQTLYDLILSHEKS